MDLLLNDLSIHGQFINFPEFRDAIVRIIGIRDKVRALGHELYCHWNIVNQNVSPGLPVNQSLGRLSREQRAALRSWLTKRGPFWEDIREHGPDDYLECRDEIVTDTAVGEVAYCLISGIDRQLVSLSPSSWEYTPIPVTWVANERRTTEVPNWWECADLTNALERMEPPICSWAQLKARCLSRYHQLKFSTNAFEPLNGLPFSWPAAEYIMGRLNILNEVMGYRDSLGTFTSEARPILDGHLTRGSVHFSDSSTEEKRRFRNELAFPHPDNPGQTLHCPWHAKVKPLLIRVHFSWPVPPGEDLYIVYVGRKRTADN